MWYNHQKLNKKVRETTRLCKSTRVLLVSLIHAISLLVIASLLSPSLLLSSHRSFVVALATFVLVKSSSLLCCRRRCFCSRPAFFCITQRCFVYFRAVFTPCFLLAVNFCAFAFSLAALAVFIVTFLSVVVFFTTAEKKQAIRSLVV